MSSRIDHNLVVKTVTAVQLDLMRAGNQYGRDGDGMMAELYKSDSRDVFRIRIRYRDGFNFTTLIGDIMELDTAVRDRVLEELENVVGRDPIEATGSVRFAR